MRNNSLELKNKSLEQLLRYPLLWKFIKNSQKFEMFCVIAFSKLDVDGNVQVE